MASLQEFEKALMSLKVALYAPKSDLQRDGTIQRFEFCVELAWKTAKKVMVTSSPTPKTILREMLQQGLIDDFDMWIGFLEARILSSHTYNEELALKVYRIAEGFLAHGEALLLKLKAL